MNKNKTELQSIIEEKNQLEKEKSELLQQVEKYRSELSEIHKMVGTLKNSYLQEQKKIIEDNEVRKVNASKSTLEEQNKYLQARLSAYKNSKLGKVTTWYWNFRKK
jgi:prefoldin subunit 5